MSDFVVEVSNVSKSFPLEAGFFAGGNRRVYAVNDVSFGIRRGSTYGIVGESGCGKTTTARMIVGLHRPDAGTISYKQDSSSDGVDVSSLGRRKLRLFREKVKYIFQDPAHSLNPRLSVGDIITDSYRYSSVYPGRRAAGDEARDVLSEVGLSPEDADRHPSEFSGGQRQRISIARGLIMKPDVLVCDEIVSALDVSVQGQILNLLQDIKESRGLSLLFIAHDLRVSCYFCDTIGVMYCGFLVEEAPAADLYRTALHPYSRMLFGGAGNFFGAKAGEARSITGVVSGCPFAHRCPHASSVCLSELPPWKYDGNHKVRCHLL